MLLLLIPALFFNSDEVLALIGGSPVPIAVRPFHVALYVNVPTVIPWCGGTIISKRSVLTAAHCFRDRLAEDILIRVGTDNLAEQSEDNYWYNVMKYIPHEKFDVDQSTRWSFDIAILIPVANFEFEASVQPIPLSTKSPSNAEIAYVSAYTVTQPAISEDSTVLLVKDLRTWDGEYCQRLLTNISKKLPIVSPTQFCATDLNGGEDSCILDGGGPITTNISGGFLLGVASWEPGCQNSGVLTFYTDVFFLTDWIEAETEEFV